jgi:hypothetical protein
MHMRGSGQLAGHDTQPRPRPEEVRPSKLAADLEGLEKVEHVRVQDLLAAHALRMAFGVDDDLAGSVDGDPRATFLIPHAEVQIG